MSLAEKIENAFASRPKPTEMGVSDEVWQLDAEVEEALWFSGRDWNELTWMNWQEHSSAIYFFAPDAFAYYLPSVLVRSAQNPSESLMAADALLSELDRSPDTEGWTEGFASRFLGLHPEELEVLKGWLLEVCEYVPYKRWGVAAWGPGDLLVEHTIRSIFFRERLKDGGWRVVKLVEPAVAMHPKIYAAFGVGSRMTRHPRRVAAKSLKVA